MENRTFKGKIKRSINSLINSYSMYERERTRTEGKKKESFKGTNLAGNEKLPLCRAKKGKITIKLQHSH